MIRLPLTVKFSAFSMGVLPKSELKECNNSVEHSKN